MKALTLYTDPAAVARRQQLGKLSKATLADMMIRNGTVYPNRRNLMKWRHDELVMGVLRREFPNLPEADGGGR